MVPSEALDDSDSLLCSILFVPASRPDRIQKALDSGADAVIVDLEDAVAENLKASARASLDSFLAENPKARILIRVNGPNDENFGADLEMCRRHPNIAGIMVPKAETVGDLEKAAACGKPLWPLVETSKGVLEIPRLVAFRGVVRLSFGALDLCAELGIDPLSQGAKKMLDHCRCRLVLSSVAMGLTPPVESVYPDINDEAAIERTALHAREIGMTGMLCIHPRQLGPVHKAFGPKDEEVKWAQRIVNKLASSDAAFSMDGQMIDAPVIARARRVLAASEKHARSRK